MNLDRSIRKEIGITLEMNVNDVIFFASILVDKCFFALNQNKCSAGKLELV